MIHFLGKSEQKPAGNASQVACQACFDFPSSANSQLLCPETLAGLSRMTNFYTQRSMSYALEQMASDPSWRLPMAVYLDLLQAGGTFAVSADTDAKGYAYVGAMLSSAMVHNNSCTGPGKTFPSFSCSDVKNAIANLMSAGPVTDKPNLADGQTPNWPPLPDYPACARGYTEASGKCYLDPYVAYLGSMCDTSASCQAPADMCSEGWTGHCHGNCVTECYADCIVDVSTEMLNTITCNSEIGACFHTNFDVDDYRVCNLAGSWVPFTEALKSEPGSFTFNNGKEDGSVDPYECRRPSLTSGRSPITPGVGAFVSRHER